MEKYLTKMIYKIKIKNNPKIYKIEGNNQEQAIKEFLENNLIIQKDEKRIKHISMSL